MSEYENARERVARYVAALLNHGAPFMIDQQHGAVLTFDDLALLVKVPETPVVNVGPVSALDPVMMHINVIQNAVVALHGRIEALENPPVDLPRMSFVHDAGCPAGGHSPAIVRGYDGCTCKVGP